MAEFLQVFYNFSQFSHNFSRFSHDIFIYIDMGDASSDTDSSADEFIGEWPSDDSTDVDEGSKFRTPDNRDAFPPPKRRRRVRDGSPHSRDGTPRRTPRGTRARVRHELSGMSEIRVHSTTRSCVYILYCFVLSANCCLQG